MRIALALLAFALPQAAIAAEAHFIPSPSGQVEFVLPSGNIGCVWTPAGGTPVYKTEDGEAEIICDRVEPVYMRFRLQGQGSGQMTTDAGDVSCCSAPNTLQYGDFWRMGEIVCEASQSGLTCLRGASGFFVSRRKVDAW